MIELCETHQIDKQLICDEFLCGMCYHDEIMEGKSPKPPKDYGLPVINKDNYSSLAVGPNLKKLFFGEDNE